MSNVSESIARGKEAMLYFHNAALHFPENYQHTLQSLFEKINSINPFFLEGFGDALDFAAENISESRIKQTLEKIASDGQGRLPKNLMDFFHALNNEAKEIKFVDAVRATASGTVTDLVAGAQQVGNLTIGSATQILKYAPFILAGGVFIYAFAKGRS